MSKPLETHQFLSERVQKIVERLAPDQPIRVEITYQTDQIEWDKDGSFGRVCWACKITIPLGHPARAFLPKLNRAIAYLQSRYDLGVLAREAEPSFRSDQSPSRWDEGRQERQRHHGSYAYAVKGGGGSPF